MILNLEIVFLMLVGSLTTIGSYAIDESTAGPEGTVEIEYGTEAGVNQSELEGTTSFAFSDPSQTQLQVMSELEAIWDYTETLNDTELKSSLTSLVQLTYARLHTEPEESLERLKYLLTKLRFRLGDDPSAGQKRSFPINEDTDSELNFLTSNILAQLQTGLKTHPPIQNPQEVLTFNQISNQNLPVAEPPVVMLELKLSHPGSSLNPVTSTVSPNTTLEVSLCTNVSLPIPDVASNTTGILTNGTQSNSCPWTTSTNQNTTDADHPAQDAPAPDIFSEIFSALLTNTDNITVVPKPLPVYVETLLTKVATIHEEDILQTPFDLQELKGPKDSNATDYDFIFDYDLASEDGDDLNTDSDPILLNFLHELTAPSEVDPVFAAASMINGTRDGLIRFVKGFTRLKKYVKIVVVFIISTGMIGTGLFFYKHFPPLLFAGLISAVIPLFLLSLLDSGVLSGRTSGGKRKSNKVARSSPLNSRILIVSDAIDKYN